MYKNIIFIGGVHGSGKGTICSSISEIHSKYIHLTSSKILRWEEISSQSNKLVQNISTTQERFLKGLKISISKKREYIIDGHFTLLDSYGTPSKIPLDVFSQMNPKILAVVITHPNIILDRLFKRDGVKYNINLISEMQDFEVNYATEISNFLSIPLIRIENDNLIELLNVIE